MANKYAAKGTVFELGGAASGSESYAVIDGVQTLGIPSDSADELDVTTHDSPGGRKEFVNGLIDSDDLSVSIVYDAADADHAALRVAAGGVAQHFRITLTGPASNTVHTFDGLVKGFAIDLPHDGIQTAAITIKRSGDLQVA